MELLFFRVPLNCEKSLILLYIRNYGTTQTWKTVVYLNDFNNYLEQLETVDAQSLKCDVPTPVKWVWRPFAVNLKLCWDLDDSGIYWELAVDDVAEDDEVTQVPVDEYVSPDEEKLSFESLRSFSKLLAATECWL